MRLEYDKTADALDIALADGIVSRTVELDPGTLVDLDEHGAVVSIEVIHPSRLWPLDAVLANFPIGEEDAAMLTALWNDKSPFPFAESLALA